MQSGVISAVHENSIAEEIGLEIGDKILTVNGRRPGDIIDLSFALADEEIELHIEKTDGRREWIEFDKDLDEELGVELESAVFDGIRRCRNKCWFCFVDQIAPNMRSSLSVKDDDYRMSFLYGNFVTLTNLTEEDLSRIKRLHLSPLFVSVHTTDGELRANMLHNKRAAAIMEQLKQLIGAGAKLHTQVVLCPGVNDGGALEKTIKELAAMRPAVRSLAIVPVGLTKYRDKCHPLKKFTKEQAARVIDAVTAHQNQSRAQTGEAFVYLGDEFYFLAGRELPAYEAYDAFPQLENGVGLTRKFIAEWEEEPVSVVGAPNESSPLDVVCGKSAKQVLERLIADLALPKNSVRVAAIENAFFGKDITVTGLLTGQDILKELKRMPGKRSGVVIPGIALRGGDEIFLDDYALSDLGQALETEIKVAYSGGELKRLLANWHGAETATAQAPLSNYTWQSNCGYTKN